MFSKSQIVEVSCLKTSTLGEILRDAHESPELKDTTFLTKVRIELISRGAYLSELSQAMQH